MIPSLRLYSGPQYCLEAMPMSESSGSIESTLQEQRLFPPPVEFADRAHVRSRAEYDTLYRESIDHPDTFWARMAEAVHWFKRWDKVLEWNLPYAKWFLGGQLNISYACLDAQIARGRGDKRAIVFEAEPGDVKSIT